MAKNNGNNDNNKNKKDSTHYHFKISTMYNNEIIDTVLYVRPNKLEQFFSDMSKRNQVPVMISAPITNGEESPIEDRNKDTNVYDPNNPSDSTKVTVHSDDAEFVEEGKVVTNPTPKPKPKPSGDISQGGDEPLYACFVSDTLIDMFDGSTKEIQDIKEGDLVKSFKDGEYISGKVTKKLVYEINDVVPVAILEGITGSIYHPVFINNKWTELGEASITKIKSNMFIDTYYNLEIDGDNNNSNHNYIINGHIMSGLGDNEKLNNKFKRQNIYKELV